MGDLISMGKDSVMHLEGKNPQRLIEEKSESDGKLAVQTSDDTHDQSFTAGRTIGLANYEFARVSCGIKIGLPLDSSQTDQDLAHARCVSAIDEVLDREEASVRGEDRELTPIDLNGVGKKVSIWLDYGLTLKKKGFDSNKVDVSSSRRLTDGSDFEEQLESLIQDVGGKLGKYKDKIRGVEGSLGF